MSASKKQKTETAALDLVVNTKLFTVATCNLNQWAMDFTGNLRRIEESIRVAKARGARYRCGPELEVSGYGCEDHFHEGDTILHCWQSLASLLAGDLTDGILCDIGMPIIHKNVRYNCRVFLLDRKMLHIRPKICMADDGNYRETRWFTEWNAVRCGPVLGRAAPPPSARLRRPTRLLSGVTGPRPRGVRAARDDRGDHRTEDGADRRGGDCGGGHGGGERDVRGGVHAQLAAHRAGAGRRRDHLQRLGLPPLPPQARLPPRAPPLRHEQGRSSPPAPASPRLPAAELRRPSRVLFTTAQSGGVYLYANQRGCDGGRLYYDGCACIVLNGEVLAQGSQFSLHDVEVPPAPISPASASASALHLRAAAFLLLPPPRLRW